MGYGLEIRIPGVEFTSKVGFPNRVNVSTTDVTIQENLQYMGTTIQMSPSKQPLNTLNDDLQWSIVDGSTYAYINASTGKLTIKEGTITQMVKVKAQSRLNASVFDEKEVVLTYKEQPVIEELNYDISISGLFQKMIFVSTDTIYSVAAELVPTTTDEYVVCDITEGMDKVIIQDVSFLNGKTNFTFTFAEPVEEITDIVFSFYHENNYDIRKDMPVKLHNKVRSIMFRNVDAGPYIADRMYKFDYYTDPVLTQRKLDVSLIQGSEYIYQWYDTSVNGTSGTINFVRNNNDVGQGQTVIFKVSDVSTDTSNNISFEFDQIPVHRIDVSGNKTEYINDVNNYYSFTWEEVPNEYQRDLNVSVYDPSNLITYYRSDVSFGKGQFNFKSTSLNAEGDVSVRIYDPNNTLFGQDVLFSVKNPVRLEMQLEWETMQDYLYVEHSLGETVPDWLLEEGRIWAEWDGRYYYEDGLLLSNYPGEVEKYYHGIDSGGSERPAISYTIKFNDSIDIEFNIDVTHFNWKREKIFIPGYWIIPRFISVLTNQYLERPLIVTKTITTNTGRDFPGRFQKDNGEYQIYSDFKVEDFYLTDFIHREFLVVSTFYGGYTQDLFDDLYRIKLQSYDELHKFGRDGEYSIVYVYLKQDEQYVIDFFTARNTKEIVYRYSNDTWSGQDVVDYVYTYWPDNPNWANHILNSLSMHGEGAPYSEIIAVNNDRLVGINGVEPEPGTIIDNTVQVGDIYNINYDIKAGDNYEMEYKVNIKINII